MKKNQDKRVKENENLQTCLLTSIIYDSRTFL